MLILFYRISGTIGRLVKPALAKLNLKRNTVLHFSEFLK